jgi:hypothetical protein
MNKTTKTQDRNRLANLFVRGDFCEAHYEYAKMQVAAKGKEYAAQAMLKWIKWDNSDPTADEVRAGKVGITHLRRAIALNF